MVAFILASKIDFPLASSHPANSWVGEEEETFTVAGAAPSFKVRRLDWSDEELGSIELAGGTMKIRASFGSGLARRASDPPDMVWAVGDRGPNLKIKTLVKRYGANHLQQFADLPGAKVMPRLDLGPRIAQLRITEDRVEHLASFRLVDQRGAAVSGLPPPGSEHADVEPALDLEGNRFPADPSGLDTEGIVALADGGFWIGDEFGPSLVRTDATGRVLARYVPQSVSFEGAPYPVHGALPALAGRRQLNRGFEALAISADENWLFLAFQSPLAHPDEAAHERASHVRLWRLDSSSLAVAAQHLYPLDPPQSFRRDAAKGEVERRDIKVSELVCLGEDRLLVLERASETTKIYRVHLSDRFTLPPDQLDVATRPTIEELSGRGELKLPVLEKELIFTSDDAPEVSADLEGMAILSPTELLLVNDNDFGVEGAETAFWRVSFDQPILR